MDKSLKQLAVLYADVSGSTRLYEQFGDAIARTDLALCIEILRDIGRNPIAQAPTHRMSALQDFDAWLAANAGKFAV